MRNRSPPVATPISASGPSVSNPRIAIACHSGRVCVAAFMVLSFRVKAAMAIIM